MLLYLVDAGKNAGVGSVASVSGGSLTNGYVAQGVDYTTVTPHDFWALAARLTEQIGRRGTLWAARLTWIYVALLIVFVAAGLVAVWFIPIGLWVRVLLFVVAVLVVATFAGLRGWIGARSFASTLFSPAGRRTSSARSTTTSTT